MVYRLKSVAVWPVVRIAFVVNAAIGLLFGGLYGIVIFILGLAMDAMGGDQLPFDSGLMSGVLGFLLMLFSGTMYGVFGAVFAAVAAWLYNVMARFVGGIELDFEIEGSVASLPDLSQPDPVPLAVPALPANEGPSPAQRAETDPHSDLPTIAPKQ